MWWIVLALAVTHVYSLQYRQDTAKFHINVKEYKSRFVQHIEADMYRNHVYYHTPKHNKTRETHSMQDFKTGLHLSCWPELQKCYVNHVEDYPDAATVVESMARMWSKGEDSIKSENETEIIQNWVRTGNKVLDLSFLGPEMREFRHKFTYPLYWRTKLPDDALILDDQIPSSALKGYVKRGDASCTSASIIRNYVECRNHRSAQRKYVYTDHACDHIYYCKEANCGRHHVFGRHYFIALCCPEATRISECFDCKALECYDCGSV